MPVTQKNTTSSWDSSAKFWTDLSRADDWRSDWSRTMLGLIEATRGRWEPALECCTRMGLTLEWARRGDRSLWVTAELTDERDLDLVKIAIHRKWTQRSGDRRGTPAGVVGGDICRVDNAPQVLESFLLQLAEPPAPRRRRLARLHRLD